MGNGYSGAMFSLTRGFSLLISILLMAGFASALTPAELDRLLSAEAKADRFSGVVRIVEHGRVVFEKAYGMADPLAGVRMTKDFYFDIASLTKHVTAAALLRLHHERRLSIHDPIGKYLPGIRDDLKNIPLLAFVTHRSGLGYPDDSKLDEMWPLEGDPRRYFEFLLNNAELVGRPEEKFDYNNLAYSMLAYIVSVVSGQLFEDYVQHQIFKPAGADCDFARDRVPQNRRALGFASGEPTFYAGSAMDSWGMRGSTGAVCTAKGLADLEIGILSGKVLNPEILGMFYFLESLPSNVKDDEEVYSFGWFVSGPGQVAHSGRVAGFLSTLMVDTISGRVTVVLTNDEASEQALFLAARTETVR